MKDLLKYGFLAAGAYLLYRQFTGQATPPAQMPQQPSGNGPINPLQGNDAINLWAAPAPPAPAPPADNSTRALMLAAGRGNTFITPDGRSSYHTWGYLYNAVRGVPAPTPESVGMGNGGTPITVDEFLAAIATAGLSGLRW